MQFQEKLTVALTFLNPSRNVADFKDFKLNKEKVKLFS